MPLDITRYPITPEEQEVLLNRAYQSGSAVRIDETLITICRARGLLPTRPPAEPARVPLARPTEGTTARRPTRTPGEVLAQLFMAPEGVSAKRLAAELGVPRSRITDILHGARGITAQTAILLGRRFGNPAEFWLRLQAYHDLAIERRAMAAAAGRQTPRAASGTTSTASPLASLGAKGARRISASAPASTASIELS